MGMLIVRRLGGLIKNGLIAILSKIIPRGTYNKERDILISFGIDYMIPVGGILQVEIHPRIIREPKNLCSVTYSGMPSIGTFMIQVESAVGQWWLYFSKAQSNISVCGYKFRVVSVGPNSLTLNPISYEDIE